MGNSLERPLFADARSGCRATDLACILPHVTIIWDRTLIHSCPYYRVQNLNATMSDNIVLGDNFLFQTTRTLVDCGMQILETTEGVFLTTDKKAQDLEASDMEVRENFNLLLADVDFKSLGLLKILNRLSQRSSESMCNIIKTELKLFQRHFDEYLIIYDMYNNQVVVYNNFGELRKANCEQIKQIEVIEQTDNCFNDIPVFLTKDNQKITAFLTHNGILRKHSRTINCALKLIVATPNAKWRIVKIGNKSKIFNSSQKFASIQLMFNNKNDMDWSHDIKYLEKFDVWQTLSNIARINEDGKVFMTNEIGQPNQESVSEAGKLVIYSLFKQAKKYLMIFAALIFIIVIAIGCFKCRFCIFKYCFWCRQVRPTRQTTHHTPNVIYRNATANRTGDVNLVLAQRRTSTTSQRPPSEIVRLVD